MGLIWRTAGALSVENHLIFLGRRVAIFGGWECGELLQAGLRLQADPGGGTFLPDMEKPHGASSRPVSVNNSPEEGFRAPEDSVGDGVTLVPEGRSTPLWGWESGGLRDGTLLTPQS